MKKSTSFILMILKKYSQMSNDQKIRLGIDLSEIVRRVREDGKRATGF